MSACSGAQQPFFPFTVSEQLCKYRHHITHMLCVKFTLACSGGVLGGGALTERSVVLVFTFLFVSFSPGGTRWRVRRKDRQEITSVMSAKAKVCPKRPHLPQLCSPSPPPSYSLVMKSPSLQILYHFSFLLYRHIYKPEDDVCICMNS